MKKKFKEHFNNISISNKLVLYFLLIFGFFALILYYLLPVLLNYPPGAVNTSFDKEVSVLYYKYQYLLVILAIIIFFTSYLKISLRKIDNWWKSKSSNIEEIQKVRKKALTFPYSLYISMEIFPTLFVLIILMLTGSHPAILLFKIGTIIFSFATLIASLFLIITKKTFYGLLVETSKYFDENTTSFTGKSLKTKLVFQLFPNVLVIALVLALVGYYRLTIEKESLLNSYFKSSLNSQISTIAQNPTIDTAYNALKDYFNEDSTFCFIENPDGSIETSNGSTLGHFFIKYMHDLAEQYNNTVYETYTIDSQAVIQKFTHNNQTYTVGIYFEISSFSSFLLIFAIALILFIFSFFIILYVSSSLVTDISNVSKGLKKIANSDIMLNTKLPVTSDDELGALEVALNNVQDLNNKHITQLKNNQDILMEKERLASLGQLIGGISHNLKTPIMSISGAAEGLTDLINEYDSSIEDSEVTSEDHHAIANDMREWISKIHSYTEYMSDIITAVKGQAVALSENESNIFTVDELLKRVTILMRHEIQNASLTLKKVINIPVSTTLHGDINSLVQVINNLITNAIQSYNGKKGEIIELSIDKDNNNLIISVSDNGCGIPENVQEKLFKTMITTKGKNGTGLGMFMSYSTIKGHFNGDITFTSDVEKGTKFSIIIPLLND